MPSSVVALFTRNTCSPSRNDLIATPCSCNCAIVTLPFSDCSFRPHISAAPRINVTSRVLDSLRGVLLLASSSVTSCKPSLSVSVMPSSVVALFTRNTCSPSRNDLIATPCSCNCAIVTLPFSDCSFRPHISAAPRFNVTSRVLDSLRGVLLLRAVWEPLGDERRAGSVVPCL